MTARPTSKGAHDPYGEASDRILPFSVDALDARGRVVKLGASIDAVIGRHAYPEAVSRLLAEAAALAVLLGGLAEDRWALSASDEDRRTGQHDRVSIFYFPDSFRAYARFDETKVAALPQGQAERRRPDRERTSPRSPSIRRMVTGHAIKDSSSSSMARVWKRRRIIISRNPSKSRRVCGWRPVSSTCRAAGTAMAAGSLWAAGGLLVQFLPKASERRQVRDLPGGDAPPSSRLQRRRRMIPGPKDAHARRHDRGSRS